MLQPERMEVGIEKRHRKEGQSVRCIMMLDVERSRCRTNDRSAV